MFVLDTNVLSELMKEAPARQVVRWVGSRPLARLYTTSVTEAEILHGIKLLPRGRRRDRLEIAARGMFDEDFRGRVLAFASDAAWRYAEIAAERSRVGLPIAPFDAQIAAIAAAVGATLVTRNVADFAACGIGLVDPWA